MIPMLFWAVSGLGLLWKSAGKLLYPFVRTWLSKGPSLGFVHLLALHRTSLRQAALDKVTAALGTSLPVKAAAIFVGRLTLSVGLVAGVRLRASGVRVELEWAPEEEWEKLAEAIRDAERARSTKAAKADVALVEQALSSAAKRSSLSTFVKEAVAKSVRLGVEELQVVIRGPKVGDCSSLPELSFTISLQARTSRSSVIERGGTRVSASGSIAISVDSAPLAENMQVDFIADLPRVMATLLSPERLPGKRAVAVITSPGSLAVTARPSAIVGLERIGKVFSRFSQWSASVVEDLRFASVPVGQGEAAEFVRLLQAGKDASAIEQRMTPMEIVAAYASVKEWAVPANHTLDTWLAEIREAHRPIREIDFRVQAPGFSLAVLQGEAQDDGGLHAETGAVSLSMRTHDTKAEAPATATASSLSASRSLRSLTKTLTSRQLRPGTEAEAPGDAPQDEHAPLQLEAELRIDGIGLRCESRASAAAPVLAPCALSASVASRRGEAANIVAARCRLAGCEDGGAPIEMTVSSRAVWRLRCIKGAIDAASAAAAPEGAAPAAAGATSARRGAVEERRRDALVQDVRGLFSSLDTDGSGSLSADEVRSLISAVYGNYMTNEEISLASSQLFAILRGGREEEQVDLEQLQRFYDSVATLPARGNVCRRLEEFTLPVEDDLDPLAAFSSMAGPTEEWTKVHPEVLQLRWVRSLQNYAVARRFWLSDIAPTLAPRFKRWQLSEQALATDFWNDPIFNVGKLRSGEEAQDRVLKVNLETGRLSFRLADSQHLIAAPRVRVDLAGASLGLEVHTQDGHTQLCPGSTCGQLKVEASYWNDQLRLMEPFVEPWRMDLSAQEGTIRAHARDHLVVNVTPPLLQALAIAAGSLQASDSASASSAPKGSKERRVAALVFNRTHSVVKVAMREPGGRYRRFVTIPARSPDAAALEFDAGEAARGRAAARGGGADAWSMKIEGEEHGQRWSIPEDIPSGMSGRHAFAIDGRTFVVTVRVDVRSLAPIVTIGGTTTVENRTGVVIRLRHDDNGRSKHGTSEVEPAQCWSGQLGGGFTLLIPARGRASPDAGRADDAGGEAGVLEVHVDREAHVDDHAGDKVLKCEAGYRVVLLEQRHLVTRALLGRTVVCVPVFGVLNALPCELRCRVEGSAPQQRRGSPPAAAEGEAGATEDPAGAAVALRPGTTCALEDLDPEEAFTVVVEVGGHEYRALLREGTIDSRRAVKAAKSLIKHRRRRAIALECQDSDAPQLDVDIEWEEHAAVLVVYARYWVGNKTGWRLEAWCGTGPLVGHEPIAKEAEKITPAPVAGDAWSGPAAALADAPELGFMRAEGDQIYFRVAGHCAADSGGGWGWDSAVEAAPLKHWTGTELDDGVDANDAPPSWMRNGLAWMTGWSVGVDVGIPSTSGVAQLPSGSSFGLLPGGAVGVEVKSLPPPFDRSKLVLALPRYVVRNGLDEPVEVWPSLSDTRRAPHADSDLLGTWFTSEGRRLLVSRSLNMCLRFDEETLDGKHVHGTLEERDGGYVADLVDEAGRAFGSLYLKVTEEAVLEATVRSTGADGEERVEELSARKARHPVVQPGQCLSIDAFPGGGLLPSSVMQAQVPHLSMRLLGGGAEQWSTKVPLSAVGETMVAVDDTTGGASRQGAQRVIRASVQLVGATMCVVLVKGQWPYCIENRSLRHTAVFGQAGADPGSEIVLKPGQLQRFLFPDPDLPKLLLGRVVGAGSRHVVAYGFDDRAKRAQPPLRLPGRSEPAMEVSLIARGATESLVLSDPHGPRRSEARAAARRRQQAQALRRSQTGEAVAGRSRGLDFADLGLDIFVAGLHVCVVDTLQDVPRELLALTVDFVQLEKPQGQRCATFSIHSMQLDDFDQDDYFVLGPINSGLNSQAHPAAESPGFKALPWLSLRVEGPQDPGVSVFDFEQSVMTLGLVDICLCPTELRLEVPNLINLAMKLKSWLAAAELQGAALSSAEASAAKALSRSLRPGFRMPRSVGGMSCYIGSFDAEPVRLLTSIRFKRRRGGGDDEEDDHEAQLRKLSVGLWGPLRAFAGFVSRLGGSVAEASPRFALSRCSLAHVGGSINIVQGAVLKHYQQQLIVQSAQAIGSLQVLGDPANLVEDISGGVLKFMQKTGEELSGVRKGVGSGVGDLAGGVVGGALNSVSKVSGSLKEMAGSISSHGIGTDARAKNFAQGFELGISCLAEGVEAALVGVMVEPVSQFHDDGPIGFVKGTVAGVAGLAARPAEGFFGAVEKIAQGAEGQVRGLGRGYLALRRPPRAAFFEGAQGLQPLFAGALWPTWSLRVIRVSLPDSWKERGVQSLVLSLGSIGSNPESEVAVMRMEQPDAWALGQFESPEAVPDGAVIGRMGRLRGPFVLRVHALVESNIAFCEPIRILAGVGRLPLEELSAALARPIGVEGRQLDFEVIAEQPPLHVGAQALGFGRRGERLGEVTVELAPCAPQSVMPERCVPGLQTALAEIGPGGAESQTAPGPAAGSAGAEARGVL